MADVRSTVAAVLVALACAKMISIGTRRGAAKTLPPPPPPPPPPPKRAPRNHRFTRAELAERGVADGALLLAVLGEVYDVSAGAQFYGTGMEYAYFVGRDASKAFVTGNSSADLTDDLSAFERDDEFLAVAGWRSFYEKHEVYTREGTLVGGAFYDEAGEPTPALAVALERAATARRAEQAAQARRRAAGLPACSAEVAADGHRTRWCAEPGHVPRELALEGSPVQCVCVSPADAGADVHLAVLSGCAAEAVRCPEEHLMSSHSTRDVDDGMYR